jgi:hypothetical protein
VLYVYAVDGDGLCVEWLDEGIGSPVQALLRIAYADAPEGAAGLVATCAGVFLQWLVDSDEVELRVSRCFGPIPNSANGFGTPRMVMEIAVHYQVCHRPHRRRPHVLRVSPTQELSVGVGERVPQGKGADPGWFDESGEALRLDLADLLVARGSAESMPSFMLGDERQMRSMACSEVGRCSLRRASPPHLAFHSNEPTGTEPHGRRRRRRRSPSSRCCS